MDYISEYKKLKEKGFPFSETIDFSVALGKSDEIETHFKLYCMEMELPQRERIANLHATFSNHGRAGGEYLMSRLNDDDNVASHAAYLLASFRVYDVCGYSADEKATIRQVLSRLSESDDPKVRRRSLIAIGWIGSEAEIPLLNRHLLTDNDALCRAWSASSFLQLAGCERIPREVVQAITRDILIECLKTEKDVFVKGVAVEAIMEVWNTSFGLRSSAVDARNEKAVERAAKKALLFLEQNK